MPVKTITAEIDGQVRKITAEVPEGATDDQIHDAVRAHLATEDGIDQTRAQLEAQNAKPLTVGRTLLEAGKMLATPITGLLNTPRALMDWWSSGHKSPLETPHVPGSPGNPVEEAAGDLGAAVLAAKPEVTGRNAAIMERMGATEPPKPSGPSMLERAGRVVSNPMLRDAMGVLSPRAAKAMDIAARIKAGIETRAAAAESATLDQIAEGMAGKKFAKLDATSQATVREIAKRIQGGPEAQPEAAPTLPIRPTIGNSTPPPPTQGAGPMAEPMPSPAGMPAAMKPADMMRLTPQAVMDYMGQRMRPAIAEPKPTGNVVTIPSPKPEFAAETYAAEARGVKAGKLADILHQFEIPYEDARLMGKSEWEQVAKAAGVNAPSLETQAQVLFKLRKLGTQGAIVMKNPKAASIAQQLADEITE